MEKLGLDLCVRCDSGSLLCNSLDIFTEWLSWRRCTGWVFEEHPGKITFWRSCTDRWTSSSGNISISTCWAPRLVDFLVSWWSSEAWHREAWINMPPKHLTWDATSLNSIPMLEIVGWVEVLPLKTESQTKYSQCLELQLYKGEYLERPEKIQPQEQDLGKDTH